jgi:hypothetical protein
MPAKAKRTRRSRKVEGNHKWYHDALGVLMPSVDTRRKLCARTQRRRLATCAAIFAFACILRTRGDKGDVVMAIEQRAAQTGGGAISADFDLLDVPPVEADLRSPGYEISLAAPESQMTLLAASPADNFAPGPASEQTSTTVCCTAKDHTDLTGVELRNFGKAEAADCCAECVRDPNCNGWTFSGNSEAAHRRCWLRKENPTWKQQTTGGEEDRQMCNADSLTSFATACTNLCQTQGPWKNEMTLSGRMPTRIPTLSAGGISVERTPLKKMCASWCAAVYRSTTEWGALCYQAQCSTCRQCSAVGRSSVIQDAAPSKAAKSHALRGATPHDLSDNPQWLQPATPAPVNSQLNTICLPMCRSCRAGRADDGGVALTPVSKGLGCVKMCRRCFCSSVSEFTGGWLVN